MRQMAWVVAVGGGLLIVLMFIVAGRAISTDLNDKQTDLFVRHHNENLERMKDAGVVDPNAAPITRSDLEQRRREALARIDEMGGPEAVAAEAHRRATGMRPSYGRRPVSTPPPTRAPAEVEVAGFDSQVQLLSALLIGLVLLMLCCIGLAIWWSIRRPADATPAP